jgi:hypothetical protein
MADPSDTPPTPQSGGDPAPVARTVGGLDHHNSLAFWTTKIVTVKIVRLKFETDHAIMTDYDTDWQNSGSVAPKPEWTFGKPSKAVSHTKAKKIGVSADFEVYPKDADPVDCTYVGTAAFGTVVFKGNATLKGGTITFESFSSPITLSPDTVAELTGDIAWKFTAVSGGASYDADHSWGHTVYATMGDPVSPPGREAGVTRKRMAKAIELVGGTSTNDPNGIVKALMGKIQYYTLRPNPAVPAQYGHPKYFNSVGGAWAISDYIDKYAECQAIVRWVRALIMTVGCPGTADLVTIWADPNINNGRTTQLAVNSDDGLDTTKTVGTKLWWAALVDRYPEKGKVYDIEEPTSNYMGPNRYEACLRFQYGGTTTYYGGGAGIYTDPDTVLTAFYALVWMSNAGVNAHGKSVAKVEEVVRRWRDASGNLLP